MGFHIDGRERRAAWLICNSPGQRSRTLRERRCSELPPLSVPYPGAGPLSVPLFDKQMSRKAVLSHLMADRTFSRLGAAGLAIKGD
jgi:hypothetical protein